MPDLIPVRHYMTAMPETIEDALLLRDAKDRMYHLGVRHLPVLRGGKLVGILSHRDIAVAEGLSSADATDIPVASVMTPVPFTCGPNAHVEAVAREMAQHHYGSAIVVDPNQPAEVIGVFTTTDALRALADVIDRLTAP
jgi:acetoin utilization protein AcuB